MQKLTPQQEAFAQALFSGKNYSDAYREAYPTTKTWKPSSVNEKASLLSKHVMVLSRLAELRKPVIEKLQYGLEEAMKEAKDAFELARADGNANAMVAAATLRSKLNGLLIDRKEVKLTKFDELDYENRTFAIQAVGDAIAKAKANA